MYMGFDLQLGKGDDLFGGSGRYQRYVRIGESHLDDQKAMSERSAERQEAG